MAERHAACSDPDLSKLYRSCIDLLQQTGPLTGCGFFEVRRPILTSLSGTVATYMIVMLQFKASDEQQELLANQTSV
jgi:hypothetical protein